MMRKKWIVTTVGLAGCLAMGCSNNIVQENDLLKNENEELRTQYKESTNALQAADDDLRRANTELRTTQEQVQLLEEEIINAQSDTGGSFDNINGLSVEVRDKDVAITVASDLLFNSGSATLKDSAKSTLSAVASSLTSSYSDKTIVIMGYTDTDNIKKSKFKSNWHLAFDRAWSVRDHLVSKGVNKNNIAIESWGPTRPLATKAASRRVDIVIVNE
ncbi:MAG: OmpA family protein [Planctomycetota bacterium]|nr:OmpA family protein [Planctomycetota bacterium]